MDTELLRGLLAAVQEALSCNRRQDDVALPVFDPATSDNGAAAWCDNIDQLGTEFGWSSTAKVAKAGKALKGSALIWFETWQPQDGRTWDNFSAELKSLYPVKRNLSEKLYKAIIFSSDSADSYCEYAREKLRLLKNTQVPFSEHHLIELVCGGIRDINVKMASFNSSVKTTSDLIVSLSAYVKPRKRPIDQVSSNIPGPSAPKRLKTGLKTDEKTCYRCGEKGHFVSSCTKGPFNQASPNIKKCTVCKKIGHDEASCFFKKQQISDSNTTK